MGNQCTVHIYLKFVIGIHMCNIMISSCFYFFNTWTSWELMKDNIITVCHSSSRYISKCENDKLVIRS